MPAVAARFGREPRRLAIRVAGVAAAIAVGAAAGCAPATGRSSVSTVSHLAPRESVSVLQGAPARGLVVPGPSSTAAPVTAPSPGAAPAPPAATTVVPPTAQTPRPPSSPPPPSRPQVTTPPSSPPASASAPPRPAGVIPAVLGAAGAVISAVYRFASINPDGSPVRWDPCLPIHYVVNLAEAPPTAGGDVAGAIDRLSRATGIAFVLDGTSTEIPSSPRPTVQPRYGSGWAPLLIAWSRPGESNALPGGGVAAEGSANSSGPAGGNQVFGTGQLVVDAPATVALAPGFGSGLTMGQLLLHELGHVIGLDHVSDHSEIMFPTLQALTSAAYGPGDLAGLAKLGRSAGCTAPPRP